MSILFSEIYNKAIALFDDPKVTVAYETDKIQYYKIMYSFLQNAIGMFHNPSSIATRLADFTPPNGLMEIFEGDGETNTFELSEDFKIIEGSIYNYIEGDKKVTGKIELIEKEIPVEVEVEIETGEFDENGNPITETTTMTDGFIVKEVYTITFPDVLPQGQQYAVEQYFCGKFDGNFSGLNRNAPKQEKAICLQVKEIMARLLIQAWAEEQRNDYLDVNNNLTDTDFKLNPAYNMLNANNNFIQKLNTEVNELQSRLSWMIRFGKTNSYIGRG